MTKIYKSPFDLVAEAIEVHADTLNEDSSMGVTYNWDSSNHLHVIVGLETNYGIRIPNDEMMKYDNMKSIIKLYNELSGNISPSQRLKKFMKRIPIVKEFFK